MTRRLVKAVLYFVLVTGVFAQEKSAWKSASKEDKGIEYQWTQPANNSCEVSFRDSEVKSVTTLTASIQYLPHKAARQAVETVTAEVVIRLGSGGSKHIASCERVTGVSVAGVDRH